MDPDLFLIQEDVPLLVQALITLALEINTADGRRDILSNAGIHLSLLSKLIFEASPQLFANKLIASFREYRVSKRNPRYHPMIILLEYLLKVYDLEDQDRNLFNRLIRQGLENFNALFIRLSVGRLESPPGKAFGTGVLVGKQILLTCDHVLKQIFGEEPTHAWIRFGYKQGKYGAESGELFELDLKHFICHDSQSDYALLRVLGEPDYPIASLSPEIPANLHNIRLIHHPLGEPVQVSEAGQIIQIENKYLSHNITVNYGSSGAPIINQDWQVIALQRGTFSINHPLPPGINEGIPLYSIWTNLKPFLPAFNT